MSDENELAPPPAEESRNLDEVVSTEAKVEPEEKKEPEAAPKEAGDDAGEEQPKKLSGAQRAKLREQRLLNENAELQRKLEEATRQTPAQTASEADEKAPKEEDFNGDWYAYRDAKSAYEARQAIRDELRKDRERREASERQTKQADVAREVDIAHAERIEEAKQIIADFDQVMAGMKGVNVRNEVIEEIKSSENSALIAYHLAKNPDKLAALDRMNGRELAREMGRLEATVKLPAAKKQTTAPPPLDPLKGGASGSFDPDKASMDDYVAKRKAGWKG